MPKSVFGLESFDFVFGHLCELLSPPRLEVRLGLFIRGNAELFHDDFLDGVSAEGRVRRGGGGFPGGLYYLFN